MLSKMSVKKPYTVMVGIVLVIILGVVSFTGMKADLLPSMNLPYAVVYTTYVGASPEAVETGVTRPIESSMATVSNIKNISSVSAENISMVILEFEQSANMDSVSLEMRENLDRISGSFDDAVGHPLIMKLNPDMLPVMMAAVSVEGLSGASLTDYAESDILQALESIEGVASADVSGAIREELHVVLRDEYIEKKNDEIQSALEEQFADARKKLTEARDELEAGMEEAKKGQAQVESGIATIEQQQKAMIEQMQAARAEMDEKEKQLSAAKEELLTVRSTLSAEFSLIRAARRQLSSLYEQFLSLQERRDETAASLASHEELLDEYRAAKEAMASFEQQILELEESSLAEEQKEQAIRLITESPEYQAAKARLEAAELRLGLLGLTPEGLEARIAQLTQALSQLDASIQAIRDMATSLGYDIEETPAHLAEMDDICRQLEEGIAAIDEGLAQLESGAEALDAGRLQLSLTESTANMQLYKAMAQAIAGGQGLSGVIAQLETGLTQLEEGEKELEKTQETTREKLDLRELLSKDVVSSLLLAQNFSMPAGYISDKEAEGAAKILVRVGDNVRSRDALAQLVLMDLGFDEVEPIVLSDIADVLLVDNSSEVYTKINGRDGLIVSLQKQTGYSTGEVSDAVLRRFGEIEKAQEGVRFTVLMDQGVYMDFITNSVLQNMLYGALFAVLVLLLFMKNIGSTIVVAFSIPVSLMAAVAMMYFTGITINIISLSGLALGIGMLVDNSIVVIENIYRLRSEGVPVREAAIEGARQVAGAIIASTLTTVCVFLPIVFTEGLTRQLFTDMGLTIAYSLLASLVVAMTLVPMMSSGLLKKPAAGDGRIFEKIKSLYERSIRRVLRMRAAVLLIAVAVLVLSTVLALKNGTAFMPPMESTQVSVTVRAPQESTLAETGELTDLVVERLMTIDDIETVGAMIGGSGMLQTSSRTDSATLYLILKEDKVRSNAELKAEILALTQNLACEVSVNSETMDMSALGGSGLSLRIQGRDMDTLQALAGQVAALLENVEGTVDIDNGIGETTRELRLMVNKEKAAEHNLTVAQVFQYVYGQLAEIPRATTISTSVKDYPVYVLDGAAAEYTEQDIRGWVMTSTDAQGEKKEIPLADIISFETADGPSAISRSNQQRTLTVKAGIDDEHNVGLVSAQVKEKLASLKLPEGYSIVPVGEDETINDAIRDMVKMIALAIVFVYLVMVAQFQSLLLPFAIMFTIPLAFTGGFLGLALTGSEISIIALIGFVMLTGIIVNNGIVLVDYISQLREQGVEKREAIALAGRTRLRPILMTALTTILGLLLMALGNGMGSDMVQPMAIVTIGGLVYGTLMTLFVIPCMYDVLKR